MTGAITRTQPGALRRSVALQPLVPDVRRDGVPLRLEQAVQMADRYVVRCGDHGRCQGGVVQVPPRKIRVRRWASGGRWSTASSSWAKTAVTRSSRTVSKRAASAVVQDLASGVSVVRKAASRALVPSRPLRGRPITWSTCAAGCGISVRGTSTLTALTRSSRVPIRSSRGAEVVWLNSCR